MPKISVVIPTFNYGHLISEALGSVLEQTYKDFEIVIVDDGSTDNTREIVADYARKWPGKIRYFYQQNSGLSAARNLGIRESTGEYVAFLDADDIWLRDFFEKMVGKIGEGYDWVVCDNWTEYIDASTNTVRRIIQKRYLHESWTPTEMLRQFMLDDCIGGPSKVVLKKAIVVENNIYFDTNTNGREDWDFYLQLLRKNFTLGSMQEALYVGRRRDDAYC